MQTPIIFIEISVRSQGSIVSANPTKAYRNETIQLSIGEKKNQKQSTLSRFYHLHSSHTLLILQEMYYAQSFCISLQFSLYLYLLNIQKKHL
jgi:hypothetical protein